RVAPSCLARNCRPLTRTLASVVLLGTVLFGANPRSAVAAYYDQIVLGDGPLAYYQLGDAGPAALDSAGVNNGTASGAAVVFGQASLLPSGAGTSVQMPSAATSDRITAGPFEKFPGGSSGFSVEYWIRPNTVPVAGFANIVGDRDSGGDFWMMNYLGTGGILRPHFNGSGTTSFDSTSTLTPGETYHVVTTWDSTSGQANLYITPITDGDGLVNLDASSQVVGAGAPPASATNNTLYIGRDNSETAGLDSLLDHVAFYNFPLSAADVQSHFSAAFVLAVPEPSSLLLLSLGCLTLTNARWRRRLLNRTTAMAGLVLLACLGVAAQGNAALVSYWNFDEAATGTGTAFDQQGSNDGTFTGSTTRTTGLVGVGAASYPGSNPAGVDVGTSLAFTTGIAIEAFVTSPNWDGSGFEEIFRKEDGGSRILFSLQSGGILSFGLNGGGGYNEFDVTLDGTGGKPTVGQFATGSHHIVVQYDAVTGLQEMYYDGSLIASQTYQAGPNIISGGVATAYIGSNGGSETWDGVIDEFALYDAPLSATDIALHNYYAQNGLSYFFQLPEPSTGLLLVAGMMVASLRRRRP
ncbi:MAG: PEP-CTERM sorting domain-containing protein, partial [Planctomycetales bacterium]|nr:PEP-CTERM sorting domain-containing protein [Planctomycetales bacterium]